MGKTTFETFPSRRMGRCRGRRRRLGTSVVVSTVSCCQETWPRWPLSPLPPLFMKRNKRRTRTLVKVMIRKGREKDWSNQKIWNGSREVPCLSFDKKLAAIELVLGSEKEGKCLLSSTTETRTMPKAVSRFYITFSSITDSYAQLDFNSLEIGVLCIDKFLAF